MNSANVKLKSSGSGALIITEMAQVRLDLIVNTVNVTLKMTASRAFIITEMALVSLDLIV